jgi:hypothetical protein
VEAVVAQTSVVVEVLVVIELRLALAAVGLVPNLRLLYLRLLITQLPSELAGLLQLLVDKSGTTETILYFQT